MQDIHGNMVELGDEVYVLTTPTSGSRYKRLFYGWVSELSESKAKVTCYENKREVSVTSVSIVKPAE